MSEQDKDFLEQIGKTLDQGLEELDGDTLNRLHQARLAATERHKGRYMQRGWLVAGGALASVVIVLLLSLQLNTKAVNESMLEDMALLSADAELELYRDLDFYDWLAEKERDGDV
jgi:type VI protein secretion system component VasF